MNIYPVKPHKRTVLDEYGNSYHINVPESSFAIKDNKIFYGIIKNDCLISTNLSFGLNCGNWKDKQESDKDLINKFWNTTFPDFVITKIKKNNNCVELNIDYGLIILKYNRQDDVMDIIKNELSKKYVNYELIKDRYDMFRYQFLTCNADFGNNEMIAADIIKNLNQFYYGN